MDGYTLPFKLKLRGCSVKGGTFWDCNSVFKQFCFGNFLTCHVLTPSHRIPKLGLRSDPKESTSERCTGSGLRSDVCPRGNREYYNGRPSGPSGCRFEAARTLEERY